jgi:ATP-dependent protease ClpP protease subunit
LASLVWHILLPRGLILLLWWGANHLLQMPPELVWGLIMADLAVLFWVSRAHLQAADTHMRSSGAMAPIWGGYLLLLLTILASLTLWWQALLIANRPPEGLSYSEQRAQEHADRYSLSLSEDGSVLIFEGEVTMGLTKALLAELQRHPEVAEIHLTSPGGHIYEARGAARLIRERGLSTLAPGLCASACTLIFTAGTARQLGPNGQLGFHGYALEIFGGLPQIDLQAEQEKDRAFLISQGVSPEFARQIHAAPADDLWRPTPEQLRAAGLLRDAP